MPKKKVAQRRTAAKKTAQKPKPMKKAARKPAAAAAGKPAAAKAKKDGRPAQWWPALSPYLTVRDGQQSLQFYARAFGFDAHGDVMRGDDGHVQHAGMRLGDAAIMFGPEEGSMGLHPPAAGTPDSLTLYVYVPDVDALAARAGRGGAAQLQAPTDQFWGDRTAVFKDPDGYHWTFATHIAK